MKFDDREDRIEYSGTRLVNAQRKGKCAWCGKDTVWHDMNLRVFLCSEECTEHMWEKYVDDRISK